MYFQRYYLNCLAHASYMIADERTKVAAIVDPQRDIDQYVADAEQHGFEIRYVFLTHFHADFVAGHIELREKTGAKIYLGDRAQAEYDFVPVKDGDVVEFGDVRLAILETPGHTPEGISILVYDLTKSDQQPQSVLTGDTLFIGDVGRPDLLASIGVTETELAEMLYDSLRNKLMVLPDATLVYPAHGAGSMCGKNLSNEAFSTIGEQRQYNYALQPMTKEEFMRLVTSEQPEAPDYFVHDAILNRQDRPSLQKSMDKSLTPLSLDEVLKLQKNGAQVVDVRDSLDFAGAHLAGALNVPLDGKYATWAGTVLNNDQPIIVVADIDRQQEAVMRLGRIGFDNVAGYLDGGAEAIGSHDELIRRTERITATALAEKIAADPKPTIIDVRSPKEWNASHIDGSINIPVNHLAEKASSLPSDGMIVVHCQGGYRSAIAASLLQRAGYDNIVDMVGGFEAWKASKLPATQTADSTTCDSKSCAV